jgi:hypothetical protein
MVRRLLATWIGVAVVVAFTATSAIANDDRTSHVCHVTGNGSFHLITVDGHAVDAHLAHGDTLPGTAFPGGDGATLGPDCAIEDARPTVVAALTGSGITRTNDGELTVIIDAYALSDGSVVGNYYSQVGSQAAMSGPVSAFVWEGPNVEVCGSAFALGIDTIADLSIDDPSVVDCADGRIYTGPYAASAAGLEGGIDFVLNVYL